MSHYITSRIGVGGRIEGNFTDDTVKKEPQFYSCSLDFARAQGGPITKGFLDAFVTKMNGEAKDAIIDTRTHMLMPGWWPCIPGWHHDDVPRTRFDGQPNYATPAYKSQHVLALVNAEVCPTEFAIGGALFPEIPAGIGPIYKHYDKVVNDLVQDGTLHSMTVTDRDLHWFDWMTWHRGTPARINGWRWFGRISWNTQRRVLNEIRTQTQVYLSIPEEGW